MHARVTHHHLAHSLLANETDIFFKALSQAMSITVTRDVVDEFQKLCAKCCCQVIDEVSISDELKEVHDRVQEQNHPHSSTYDLLEKLR